MWKRLRCSCGNLDSRRGCGIFSGKWSCVFAEGEMDKFPQIGGTGITPESLKTRVLSGKRYNLAEPILFGKRYTMQQNYGIMSVSIQVLRAGAWKMGYSKNGTLWS